MHQDDISVAQRIADGAGNIADVQVDLTGATGDVAELRELFGSLSVVIGTRLHSCIIRDVGRYACRGTSLPVQVSRYVPDAGTRGVLP